MENRIPPVLWGILIILILIVMVLGIDRLNQLSDDDLLETVQAEIVVANEDLPKTLSAQETLIREQDALLGTQVADTSFGLQTQIALAITDENILETVDAQGVDVLTQVAEFYPSDTPTATNTPTDTPTATFTATNTYTPTATYTITTTPSPTATFTPTENPVYCSLAKLPDTVDASNPPPPLSNQPLNFRDSFVGTEFAFSQDGQLIVAQKGDDEIIVVSTQTGQVVQTLLEAYGWIYDLALSPDGRYVAAGGILKELTI